METKPRHNPFCARCGKTALMHAYPATSCEKYISPGSKEARELARTNKSLDASARATHPWAPWMADHGKDCAVFNNGLCDCPDTEATKAESIVIDSGVIDNRLVVATNEWLQAKIVKATLHLQVGLSMPKDHPSREKQFNAALKALGGLGAQ